EREEAIGPRPYEVSPGVSIARRDVEATLETVAEEGTVVQLHEQGEPASTVEPPEDPVFVLSDHRDFGRAETDLLSDLTNRRLRLGPEALHADHAIVVAHHWLDSGGWNRT
ncbi:MAG: tRNA (pseudouridine54-N1)-methyltransferase, partial [Halobacteriales archaeon]